LHSNPPSRKQSAMSTSGPRAITELRLVTLLRILVERWINGAKGSTVLRLLMLWAMQGMRLESGLVEITGILCLMRQTMLLVRLLNGFVVWAGRFGISNSFSAL